jgi:hypothetical protein
MHFKARLFVTVAAVLIAATASAQGLTSPPPDLSTLPILGVSRSDALKILDQRMKFVSVKDKSGVETLTGTPDDKTTVVFTCIDDYVVAAHVTIPIMGAEPAEQDAIKAAILLRVLTNLLPHEDWGPYPFGEIFRELARTENQRWITTIGEIQITGERARPGFLVFRVVNERIGKTGDAP